MGLAGSRFEQGAAAANAGDIQSLHDVCVELINLLPHKKHGKLNVPGQQIVSNVQ